MFSAPAGGSEDPLEDRVQRDHADGSEDEDAIAASEVAIDERSHDRDAHDRDDRIA
jgi:hypothetical protein